MTTERPIVGIGVIVINGDKVLLGKRKGAHSAGEWAPPGGHLEYSETPEDAAYRELMEETDVEALSLRRGPWVSSMIGDKHYITLFMIADHAQGEVKLMEPDKCEGWEWFSPEALPTPLFAPFEQLFAQQTEGCCGGGSCGDESDCCDDDSECCRSEGECTREGGCHKEEQHSHAHEHHHHSHGGGCCKN